MTDVAHRSEPSADLAVIYDDWTDLDRWFGRLQRQFLSDWTPAAFAPAVGGWTAPVDIEDQGESFEIRADLPGFAKDKIDVRILGTRLQIHAEQATSDSAKRSGRFLRQERSYRSVDRSLDLPEPVAAEKVAASYQDGVLVLTVPKAHPLTEKKIPVA